jgi:serine protease Do
MDITSRLTPTAGASAAVVPSSRRVRRLGGSLAAVAVASTALTGGGLVAFGSNVFAADDATVTSVVENLTPSVVTVQINDTTTAQGQGGTTVVGSGSGVIVDPSGLVLTNRHVAGAGSSFTVILSDGSQYPATFVGTDTLTDFGFVKIKGATGLHVATLGDSSALKVGQTAIAMGNPGGDLPGSVTVGVVSGLDRQIQAGDSSGTQAPETLRHVIQTDAAINPGNSGGPLVDLGGKVVGINTAGDGSAQSIGFALPIDLAKPIISQVLAGKPIARPWIGIAYTTIDAQTA